MEIRENNKLYLIVDGSDSISQAREMLSGQTRLAIDTETCKRARSSYTLNKGALRMDSYVLGVGISADKDSGVYFPIVAGPKGGLYLPKPIYTEVKNYLIELLHNSEITWIMFNALFDLSRLRKYWGMSPEGKVFMAKKHDVLLMAHELNENRSLHLKDLGAAAYGISATEEKDAMMGWCKEHPEVFGTHPTNDTVMGNLDQLPIELVGKYCIKDTMLTKALYDDYTAEIVAKKMTKSYIFRASTLPVYEEIASTGWTIDEDILNESGHKIHKEIIVLAEMMREIFYPEVAEIETNLLNDKIPIKKSPSWIKMVADKEGLSHVFTVTKKEETKITTDKKAVTNFLLRCEKGEFTATATEELLRWDEQSEFTSETAELVTRLQKQKFLDNRDKNKDEDDEDTIDLPYVFNFGSAKQLRELLFIKLGIEPLKFTKKAKAKTWEYADTGSETIERIQTKLFKDLDAKLVSEYKGKDSWLEKVELLKTATSSAIDWKTLKAIKKEDSDIAKQIKLIIFLECLLKLRDDSKIYGTYYVGLKQLLYTSHDLGREEVISPITGKPLKYLISSINMAGTKTGRPSSNNPLLKRAS